MRIYKLNGHKFRLMDGDPLPEGAVLVEKAKKTKNKAKKKPANTAKKAEEK